MEGVDPEVLMLLAKILVLLGMLVFGVLASVRVWRYRSKAMDPNNPATWGISLPNGIPVP